jgi:hypothetical protein
MQSAVPSADRPPRSRGLRPRACLSTPPPTLPFLLGSPPPQRAMLVISNQLPTYPESTLIDHSIKYHPLDLTQPHLSTPANLTRPSQPALAPSAHKISPPQPFNPLTPFPHQSRANHEELAAAGYKVFGISADNPKPQVGVRGRQEVAGPARCCCLARGRLL